ncbi:hypothetical protein ACFO0M_09965 [Micromonospora mangrovi]|uniref:Uncharacterized protein n=2 Tax=Micromonospora TaxID=1873 RepID=A0AAU7M6C6_9ACTN
MSTVDIAGWSRQYEANQKLPYLPDGNYDFDQAVAELRSAVAEIAPNAADWVSPVLRVLRHRPGLAAQVLHDREPTCLSCGGRKHCLGCDDTRPQAKRLWQGWRFVSPLNRWETVERVEQTSEYAPMRVWTDQTGPDYSWLIPGFRRLDAAGPALRPHGTAEIRIVEYDYARDAPMFAVATLDTVHSPEVADHLAEARYSREDGWKVRHRPDGGGDPVVVDCGRSKAKARTALRAAARQHAKALGVKVAQ